MKSMKRYFSRITTLVALFATLSLGGCLNEMDTIDGNNRPTEENPYVEGELIVKFSSDVEGLLCSRTELTRSNIPSVDEIFESAGVYELERVFPVDSRREELTRREGLHLWYVVRFKSENKEQVAAKLASLGEVQRVDMNRKVKRTYNGKAVPLSVDKLTRANSALTAGATMNDELLGAQWNLINNGDLFLKDGVVKSRKGADVQAAGAWERCTGHKDVIVAVLDEGIFVEHPDLKANIWVNEDEVARSHNDNDGNGYEGDINGYNFVKQIGQITWNDYMDSGHGSHVAGVIAAVNNNGIGISSIAGGNGNADSGVKIMACQIFSGNHGASVLEVARAMKYAADNGAVVLQCSWGYVSGAANEYDWGEQGFHTQDEWETGSPLEFDALDYFVHNAGSPNGPITGGVAVFAGGNENAPAAGFPGAADFAVSVAATAADFTPAVYTNYGPGTTISAPGGDQDYYWNYVDEEHNYGEVGCILSTLPYNVSESGYGFMEGTSMACPHISGVVALAIAHAAQLAIQITPEQLKEQMYKTAYPIDEYCTGKKFYHRYVADIGPLQPMQMDLDLYKGGMGAGQVDAAKLLAAIENVGVPMRFPNLYIDEGESVAVAPSRYFLNGEQLDYSVSIEDSDVATCQKSGGDLIFTGVKSGSTKATITVSGAINEQQSFVITVRKGAGGNGWL